MVVFVFDSWCSVRANRESEERGPFATPVVWAVAAKEWNSSQMCFSLAPRKCGLFILLPRLCYSALRFPHYFFFLPTPCWTLTDLVKFFQFPPALNTNVSLLYPSVLYRIFFATSIHLLLVFSPLTSAATIPFLTPLWSWWKKLCSLFSSHVGETRRNEWMILNTAENKLTFTYI